MDDENVTLWNKTNDELTFGDNMKVAAAVTAITVAVPLAMLAAVSAVVNVKEKFRKKTRLAPVAYIDAKVAD